MKFYLILMPLWFSSSSLALQAQPVEITVIDSESAAPIANATIKIPEPGRTIAVDAEGNASINLKPGKYALILSSVGYRTKTITVTDVDGIKTKLRI